MSEILISVENINKKFCRDLKRSLWYGIKDLSYEFIGLNKINGHLRKHEFWSLKNVSFEVKRGECLGLIGPNGAGKSTLLKMLHGLIKPDAGKIIMRGRVGALIELGAGFNPILTGRENIYINGAVLGFSKKEMDKKLDDIIDFAEIGDFINAPVQSYSSGMKVRLGFAIAAQMNPDILLIDEILAVGDVGFRAKCYNAIHKLNMNAAVIFVSHSMPSIARISSKCMVLNKGRSIFQGTADNAIQQYYSLFEEEKLDIQYPAGSGEALIERMEIYAIEGHENEIFRFGDSMTISCDIKVSPKYKTFLISITFMNQEMQLIAQCHSGYNKVVLENDGHSKKIQITIPKLILNPGTYAINVIIFDETNQKYLGWYLKAKKFKVVGEFVGGAHIQLLGAWNVM